jgi:hypothetical protein
MLLLVGGAFDPAAFHLQAINQMLKTISPDRQDAFGVTLSVGRSWMPFGPGTSPPPALR